MVPYVLQQDRPSELRENTWISALFLFSLYFGELALTAFLLGMQQRLRHFVVDAQDSEVVRFSTSFSQLRQHHSILLQPKINKHQLHVDIYNGVGIKTISVQTEVKQGNMKQELAFSMTCPEEVPLHLATICKSRILCNKEKRSPRFKLC